MHIEIFETKEKMGEAGAKKAADILKDTIREKNRAVFIAATGASQFEFLKYLVSMPSIQWAKTTMFHLDEYVGIEEDHPASFRRYLKERLTDKVKPGTAWLINGNAKDPDLECRRLNGIMSSEEIDVAFVGIGENGHLAFNDPPADFETEKPYIIVRLDESCRKQQLGEGWFRNLDEVPKRAISMSIRQIMKSKNIICSVADTRKAQAVKNFLECQISPDYPASILRTHKNMFLFLDKSGAGLLSRTKE